MECFLDTKKIRKILPDFPILSACYFRLRAVRKEGNRERNKKERARNQEAENQDQEDTNFLPLGQRNGYLN